MAKALLSLVLVAACSSAPASMDREPRGGADASSMAAQKNDAGNHTSSGAESTDAGGTHDAFVSYSCMHLSDPSCADYALTVDYRGTSPVGALHLTSASVYYSAGFTNGTSLSFDGTAGGSPVKLYIAIDGIHLNQHTPVVPMGSYSVDGNSVFASFETCSIAPELKDVVVQIDRHQVNRSETTSDLAETLEKGRGASSRGPSRSPILDGTWSSRSNSLPRAGTRRRRETPSLQQTFSDVLSC